MCTTRSPHDALSMLSADERSVKKITIRYFRYIDSLRALIEYLPTRPCAITSLCLSHVYMPARTEIELGRFVALSDHITKLKLVDVTMGSEVYIAVASALVHNSTLSKLLMYDNGAGNTHRIDMAFVRALRLNPDRPSCSVWRLYTKGTTDVDYARLRQKARSLGAPSMLEHFAAIAHHT